MDGKNSTPDLDEYTWSLPMKLAFMAFRDMEIVKEYSQIGAAEAEIAALDLLDSNKPIAAAMRRLLEELERGEEHCVARKCIGDQISVPWDDWSQLKFAFHTQHRPDCPAGAVATSEDGFLYHSLRFLPGIEGEPAKEAEAMHGDGLSESQAHDDAAGRGLDAEDDIGKVLVNGRSYENSVHGCIEWLENEMWDGGKLRKKQIKKDCCEEAVGLFDIRPTKFWRYVWPSAIANTQRLAGVAEHPWSAGGAPRK